MLSTLRFIFNKKSYELTLKKASLFFSNATKEDIFKYQVEQFNQVWKDAYENIEFYKRWKEDNHLPNQIYSLSELSNWPIITKKEIISSKDSIYRKYPPKSFVVTSGSTGVPLSIPSKGNIDTKANTWIGRAANGLIPGEKTFLIWGHHHLRGTGIARLKNNSIRFLKDLVLGYLRVSAYDTSMIAMNKAFKRYQKFRPKFVVAYSTSMLGFVRCNSHQNEVHRPQLVLCTAGPLSDIEKKEIQDFFKCPLCMEYGSVECGVMAFSVNNCTHYNTFWNEHIVQGFKDNQGYIKNIVTNITHRYFPLIRYDIGDYLDISEYEDLNSIIKINSIIGRPTDMVTLSNGTSFFAMLIEACVEHIDGLISHQLLVNSDKLEILLVAQRILNKEDFESILNKIYIVVPDLRKCSITIKQVDELIKNRGGKIPIVVRVNDKND